MNQPPQYPPSGMPPQYQSQGQGQQYQACGSPPQYNYAPPPRRKTSPVLIVVLLLVVGGFAALVGYVAIFAGSEPATEDWVSHTDTEGRFSCRFPKEPVSKVENKSTATGNMVLHSTLADYGRYAYIAMWSDLPRGSVTDANRAEVLDGSVNGAINGSKGTVLTKLTIRVQGYEAREYSVKNPDGMYIRGRVILVGDRLYQQIAAHQDNAEHEVDFFFDSFVTG